MASFCHITKIIEYIDQQKLNEYIDRWISVKIYVQCFCLDCYDPTMKRSSVFILPIVILQIFR